MDETVLRRGSRAVYRRQSLMESEFGVGLTLYINYRSLDAQNGEQRFNGCGCVGETFLSLSSSFLVTSSTDTDKCDALVLKLSINYCQRTDRSRFVDSHLFLACLLAGRVTRPPSPVGARLCLVEFSIWWSSVRRIPQYRHVLVFVRSCGRTTFSNNCGGEREREIVSLGKQNQDQSSHI